MKAQAPSVWQHRASAFNSGNASLITGPSGSQITEFFPGLVFVLASKIQKQGVAS
jgi:hypothetical protein